MEEIRSVRDFLRVSTDPWVKDEDRKHQEGELSWDVEEPLLTKIVGVVSKKPCGNEDQWSGDGESDQNPSEISLEASPVPQLSIIKAWIKLEKEEHEHEGREQDWEDEHAAGESGLKAHMIETQLIE